MDPINPDYYKAGQVQVIDIIKMYQLDFALGNATKYLLRAGKKDVNTYVQDLEKAVWYIQYAIKDAKANDS